MKPSSRVVLVVFLALITLGISSCVYPGYDGYYGSYGYGYGYYGPSVTVAADYYTPRYYAPRYYGARYSGAPYYVAPYYGGYYGARRYAHAYTGPRSYAYYRRR